MKIWIIAFVFYSKIHTFGHDPFPNSLQIQVNGYYKTQNECEIRLEQLEASYYNFYGNGICQYVEVAEK